MRAALLALACLTLCAGLGFAGCSRPSEPRRDAQGERAAALPSSGRAELTRARLASLRQYEEGLRSRLSPLDQPPGIDSGGADPYRLVKRGARAGFLGILRGARALVELDAALKEQARWRLPESPTALCVTPEGEAIVGSRYSDELVRYSWTAPGAPQATPLKLRPVADLDCSPEGLIYALETDGSTLLTLDTRGKLLSERAVARGGQRVLRRGQLLLVGSLFEHSLTVLAVDRRGLPGRELSRIHHDGPIWGFDAIERSGEILVAASGVEDHPLVRARGEFEYLDSFLWLYRLREDGSTQVLAELAASDYGLVVPKTVALRQVGGALQLTALASGSGRLLRAEWTGQLDAPPRISTQPAPPGASDALLSDDRVLIANPLFDAWIELQAGRSRYVLVDPETRPEAEARLGEALFFTDLMSPENPSAGSHSRFSCETCHYEGGVDGRLHYSGRKDISVLTKPLFGLANNRPHFSRALDPDLSSVSHNEFRVAGAGSGKDPWFALEPWQFPWLAELGIANDTLSPVDLRRALLTFLYRFSHAPNPRALGRSAFSELERRGAVAFRERCESCHAARVFSDEPSSVVAFADWERMIFRRNAPLVWARGDHEQTGILPYVHERGTRVPSLRRLALKPRYFTNGSAPNLADVLARFRVAPARGWHEAPAGEQLTALDEPTQRSLLAFLSLL